MKTKTETKNTPQPWVKEYIKGDYLSVDKVIISSGGDWIATVSAEHIGTIWSALNGLRSHEELLEACKQIVWKLSHNHSDGIGPNSRTWPGTIDRNDATVKMAVEAIAKAEGRQ